MEVRRIRIVRGGELRKPTENEIEKIANKIDRTLYELGFRSPFGSTIKDYGRYYIRISKVRLNKEVWGLNVSPYQEVMGYSAMIRNYPILNYWQWGIVNIAINVILDLCDVSANVRSLNGAFTIREGITKFDFHDWSDREHDNIGSIIYPIIRAEAWKPKSIDKFSKMIDLCEKRLINIINEENAHDPDELIHYVTYNFEYIREHCPFYVKIGEIIQS